MKAASLLLLVLVACSDSDGGGDAPGKSGADTQGNVSSCNLAEAAGYCLDFEPTAPEGIAQQNCDNAKSIGGLQGQVNDGGPCPGNGRVGSCVATISDVLTTYRYYDSKFDAAAAQENCTGLGGAFTPN